MNKITIRQATSDDVAALSDVGKEAFAEAYGPHTVAEDLENHLDDSFGEDTIRSEVARNGCLYLIAEVDGEAAGLCKILAAPGPEAVSAPPSLEIRQLYVRPAFQRYGLGRRMVDATFAEAARHARAGVWLGVWERADWALRFYERCGFRTVGAKTFRLGDTDHNDLVMWRATEESP